MARIMRSGNERGCSVNGASFSTCEKEVMSLLLAGRLFLLDHICTRAFLEKLAQSISNSSAVVLIGRRWM